MKTKHLIGIFVFLFLVNIINVIAVIESNPTGYTFASNPYRPTLALGVQLTPSEDITGIQVQKHSLVTGNTSVYVYNGSSVLLGTYYPFIGNIINLTGLTLYNGQTYYILIGNLTHGHMSSDSAGVAVFPIVNPTLSYTNGCYKDGAGAITCNQYGYNVVNVSTGFDFSNLPIRFNSTTPTNNTYYNSSHNYIEVATETYYTNIINMTHFLYLNDVLINYTNNTVNFTTNFSGLSTGTYKINATVYNSTNSSSTETRTIYIGKSLINITAYNYTGGALATFNATINGINYTTSSSMIQYNANIGETNNISIIAVGYAYDIGTIKVNTTTSVLYNRTLYPYNSVYFIVMDETGTIITTPNTTIEMTDGINAYNTTTISGLANFTGVTTGTYTATFLNTNYQSKQLIIIVSESSTQQINAYLNNGTAILFNYRDFGSSAIPGVNLKVYRFINSTLTQVGEYTSDVTGKIQFYANTNTFYAFNNTKDGYVPYYFTLNPILFTSYDIPMSESVSGTTVPTGYVLYNPSQFYQGRTTNFTIQFISPYNSFTSYQYNFTYPGGSITDSGTAQFGEIFTNTITITDASNTANLYYTFLLSNGVNQSFNITFNIIEPWQNKTIMNIGEKDYGMLIGDKVYWLTLIMIIVMGTAYLAIGAGGAVIFGGLLLLIMTVSGYIPVSAIPIYYVFGFGIAIILIFKGFSGGGVK